MKQPVTDLLTRAREDLECAVRSRARVLLTGGANADTEAIALWIHDRGTRRSEPFVSIDGAASQITLESGMPGSGREPYSAHAGTLFIGNVAKMNAHMQSELVRALDHSPDAPIIAATNDNLHDEVLAGRFREDLFYRLNTIHIVCAIADVDQDG